MKWPYLKAMAVGATIGIIPAWLVSFLAEAFPGLKPEELQIVSEFMANGIGPVQILFFLLIVLWKLFEWKLPPFHTWIAVSVLFALVHLEPLHILGLLPFSFFVGWLRYRTNKLGPSIVAHMTNNAVACLLMAV